MRRTDPELLADRARDLEANGLNGLRLVFVDLLPAAAPTHAELAVQFHNDVAVAAIEAAVNLGGVPPTDIFTLRGGTRIRAGAGPGELRVAAVSASTDARTLVLTTTGIGDYSTYTLEVAFAGLGGDPLIDPLFGSLPFKFRPGCFNLNCAPGFEPGEAPAQQPAIDYLARDFDSIKHVLINAMRERVPDWQPTSEADLDLVILDLLAADADELCDFQDRVMQEAYLGLARKRVSLARHARLMDYHIHQGNQAGTWLVAEVGANLLLPAQAGVWTGPAWSLADAVIFVTEAAQACLADLNRLELYTWGGVVMALEAGAIEAELALPPGLNPLLQGDAQILRDHLRRPDVRHLVIEEKLNPDTGTVNGVDLGKRQLLRLLDGDAAAEVGLDPLAGHFFVRVRWRQSDRLTSRYCFITRCPDQAPTTGVSAFHGNLVHATHGRPHRVVLRPPGTPLGPSDAKAFRRYDEAWWEASAWGTLADLPQGPLAYRDTPPGGEEAPVSTTVVGVSGIAGAWEERIDLIESEDDDAHYLVETDELARSRLRFGNGVNGMRLDADATVTCDYQVGRGSAGNVGADALGVAAAADGTPLGFDAAALPGLQRLRNPFDVRNGRDPEPRREILRRVPEAYRQRQLRAVTLADYVQRAEQLSEVSHAYARYAWTGSWRTVQVSIDPRGSTQLDEPTRRRIEAHLDAVRLIGEDLEVRAARYVALDIAVRLCAHPDYWPEDLELELQREFSTGYTADGRPGLFQPEAWTFGQPLYASQIVGRALRVQGVERVLSVSLRRWNAGTGPTTDIVVLTPDQLPAALVEKIDVRPFEIVEVANDPDHLEHGRILFDVRGGRQ
jgi:hypothetical protein